MTRDIALRIDAMLIGVRASLDSVAIYLENNLSREDYLKFTEFIGRSMGETVKISNRLYDIFPDIVPAELQTKIS